MEYGRAKAFGEVQTMIDGAGAMVKSIVEQQEKKKSYEF